MAKKKRHKNKKHINKASAVKTTTKAQEKNAAQDITKQVVAKPEEVIEKNGISAVSSDVRYSLLLLGLIIAVFAVLFVVLSNKSVSSTVYGLIKINF
jgi:hypothetical protein